MTFGGDDEADKSWICLVIIGVIGAGPVMMASAEVDFFDRFELRNRVLTIRDSPLVLPVILEPAERAKYESPICVVPVGEEAADTAESGSTGEEGWSADGR